MKEHFTKGYQADNITGTLDVHGRPRMMIPTKVHNPYPAKPGAAPRKPAGADKTPVQQAGETR